MLRWCLQKGYIAIPKSTHRARILENAAVWDFALSPEQMGELDRLEANHRVCWNPLETPWSG